jgi:hypothetical protein
MARSVQSDFRKKQAAVSSATITNTMITAQIAGSIAPGKPVHTPIDRYGHQPRICGVAGIRERMLVIIPPSHSTRTPSLTLAFPPHASR